MQAGERTGSANEPLSPSPDEDLDTYHDTIPYDAFMIHNFGVTMAELGNETGMAEVQESDKSTRTLQNK